MPPRSTKPLTKAEILREVSDKTDLTQGQIESVFDALESMAKRELNSKGEFSLVPGLLKVKKGLRPAAAARDGRNPSTGAPIRIAAKPAHNVVKVTMLKTLKDMV